MAPTRHHDRAATPTNRTLHTYRTPPTRSHRWRHGHEDLRPAVLQLLCVSDPHHLTDKRLLLQLLPLRGYDATPLCHFQSSFNVFALCSSRSHLLNFSWIWFLPSNQQEQWYILRFSVPSSKAHPWHPSSFPDHSEVPLSPRVGLHLSRWTFDVPMMERGSLASHCVKTQSQISRLFRRFSVRAGFTWLSTSIWRTTEYLLHLRVEPRCSSSLLPHHPIRHGNSEPATGTFFSFRLGNILPSFPRPVGLPSHHCLTDLNHVWLPIDYPGLLQQHLLHFLWATVTCSSKSKMSKCEFAHG